MPFEPSVKRTISFIDGQNLYLSEVAAELRTIAAEQGRWIKAACAFPISPTTRNRRGIDKTDWIHIERHTTLVSTTAIIGLRNPVRMKRVLGRIFLTRRRSAKRWSSIRPSGRCAIGKMIMIYKNVMS